MKTPEELADLYISKEYQEQLLKEIGPTDSLVKKVFLAGYQAAAPQWISVKDRLPEISKRMSDDVLILDCYGEMSVEPFEKCGDEIGVDWGEAGLRPLSDFTHWMPLPKPPTEENKD